jgi:hypothetical protein
MMDRRDFVKYLGLAGAGAALLKVNPAWGAPKMQGQSHKMKTLNILFDSWSSQVLFQQSPGRYPVGFMHPEPTGRRLNTILGAMKSYGFPTGYEWNVSFTHSRVTPKELAGVDVYVSLTRYINELNPPPPVTGTGFFL